MNGGEGEGREGRMDGWRALLLYVGRLITCLYMYGFAFCSEKKYM